jgi:hypothetical protein
MVRMVRLFSVALLFVIGDGSPGMAQTMGESQDLDMSGPVHSASLLGEQQEVQDAPTPIQVRECQ